MRPPLPPTVSRAVTRARSYATAGPARPTFGLRGSTASSSASASAREAGAGADPGAGPSSTRPEPRFSFGLRTPAGAEPAPVSPSSARAVAAAAARDPGAHLRPRPAREPAYLRTAPAPATEGAARPRSALFGDYPTRTALNLAARRAPPRNKRWRGDPVAVMQNSPLRRCAVSHARLHTAYMLNLRALLVRDKRGTPRVLAAPDGLQHPRYAARRTGQSAWVALHRDVVSGIGNSKRQLANITKGPPKVPDGMLAHIGAELVTRVAQELELLRQRIASARPPRQGECSDAARVLRPLSKAEVEAVERGVAPRGAVAVLDVRFGARSRLTQEEREHPRVPMLRREGARNYDPADGGDVPLFPLHALLGAEPRAAALVEDVMSAERGFARRCAEAAGGHVTTPVSATEEVEAHRSEEAADLVAVQVPTVSGGRGGGVPLVVALWRVALWRGEGWDLVEAEKARAEAEEGDEGEGGVKGEGSAGEKGEGGGGEKK